MVIEYAFKENGENIARAYGNSLGISTKQSVEVCSTLRGMPVKKAKELLERVIVKEQPIEIKRYNRDTAHKKGMAAGKYPINAAKHILAIIKSAESNAKEKAINTEHLIIKHISAHMASRPSHYGRQKKSVMKRTNIQVVLLAEKEKTEKKEPRQPKTAKQPKTETKVDEK